jgi:hypothetical protein
MRDKKYDAKCFPINQLYGTTLDELSDIIDISEDIGIASDQPVEVLVPMARKRMNLTDKIKTRPIDKVWIVGIGSVDGFDHKYTCLSEETANRRWEEVKQEMIKELKERIEQERREPNMTWWADELQKRADILSTIPKENISDVSDLSDEIPVMYCREVEP